MAEPMATILHFQLKTSDNPRDLMQRFLPGGGTLLNRSEWQGKPPRSCGIIKVQLSSDAFEERGKPKKERIGVANIYVAYRPSGYISFVGQTKYDGWTAVTWNRSQDGTYLNEAGEPLEEGRSPIELRFEVHKDIEFNEMDFGELVSEDPVVSTKVIQHDELFRRMRSADSFGSSVSSSFVATRRRRPQVMIVLANGKSGTQVDGWGTRHSVIDKSLPHFESLILDQLNELVSGFLEGRYSIQNSSFDDSVFLELSKLLVDVTPNERGEGTSFDCLGQYFSSAQLEDLAHRIEATYLVNVTIVHGDKFGLLLQKVAEPPQ